MPNKLARREYRCKCKQIVEDYVWESELKGHTIGCTMCSNMLSYANLKVKKAIQMASIRTPTKNR